jgi:tetratricopeptide (TPR) repeat protein
MSLERHATTLLLHGDFEPALQAIEEALALLPNKGLTVHSRAKALTIRARCAAHLGQFSQAELDLREAAELIQPTDPALPFSGARSLMAAWWQASSVVCAERKDWAGAIKAAREELALRRFALLMPHLNSTSSRDALAMALARLAQYSAAGGFFEEARIAGEESKEIRRSMRLAV